MPHASTQPLPKRRVSLQASSGPIADDRFQRKDKPAGQEVTVSRGEHGDLVLLHRLSLEPGSSLEVRESLLKVAQSTALFHHPEVLSVREAKLEGDSLVFVQDYPHGPLLADYLIKNGRIPLPEALKWMRRFSRALEAAETAGLTISQICPTEFVVREASDVEASSGLICLCPPVPAGWWLEVEDLVFASPEQKAGQACDLRSALYSSGALLAAMVTGLRPAAEEGWAAILSKQSLPKGAVRALKGVLDLNPDKRCPSPGDWSRLLEEALSSSTPAPAKPVAKSVTVKEVRAYGTPIPAPSPSLLKPSSESFPTIRADTPTGLPWAGSALAVAVFVAALLLLMPRSPAPPEKPQDSASHPSSPLPVTASQPPTPMATPLHLTVKTSPPESVKTVPVAPAPQTASLPPAPAPLPPPPAKPPASPSSQNLAPSPVVSVPSVPESKPVEPSKPVQRPSSLPVQASAVQPPATPQPSRPAENKPVAPSANDVLEQAARAPVSERAGLFRQILADNPGNTQALRGLVTEELANIPGQGPELSELRGRAEQLLALHDPLGTHALGCITLQEAGKAADLTTATKTLVQAADLLKHSLKAQHAESYFFLIQTYVNLHNVRVQNGARPEAEQTRRTLLGEIASTPAIVPAKDPRHLAQQLEGLLNDRAASGRRHSQADFLQSVINRLYAVAAERGDAQARDWMKTHPGVSS
ncbi:MAG: serine/threonine protein kinase [Verrucomicrobiaceae bacterium]|nr:serine/threonine protein kinase [Verrucomicrobiaceae bacterium]